MLYFNTYLKNRVSGELFWLCSYNLSSYITATKTKLTSKHFRICKLICKMWILMFLLYQNITSGIITGILWNQAQCLHLPKKFQSLFLISMLSLQQSIRYLEKCPSDSICWSQNFRNHFARKIKEKRHEWLWLLSINK